MRVKNLTIAVVVLAVGATPAVAGQQNALRTVPAPVATTTKPAVWIPAPSTGIKWTGTRGWTAVRGR